MPSALPHCTGTGTSSDPYIFTTPEGFFEAIDVEGAYIEAGQNNLTFNFNNVSYTLPLTIKCISLDAKGLTLFNIVAQGGSYDILYFPDSPASDVVIKNLNIYNFCILVNDAKYGSHHLIKINSYIDSSYAKEIKWVNCNFAGCIMGHSNATTSIKDSGTLIGYASSSEYNFSSKYNVFENCTLNIHLRDNYTGSNSFTLAGSGGYSHETVFKNCTICISGNVPNKFIYCGVKVALNNTTFTNSETNPLTCYLFNWALSSYYGGYNYYKAYITAVSGQDGKSIYIADTLGLVNQSRMTAYNDLFSTTGIAMKEYDPSTFLLATEPADWSTNWTDYFTKSGNEYSHVTGDAAPTFATNTYYDIPSDYIYLSENLSNAGFLIGQVIT